MKVKNDTATPTPIFITKSPINAAALVALRRGLPAPETIVVLSLSMVTFLAPPSSSIFTFSSLMPRSSVRPFLSGKYTKNHLKRTVESARGSLHKKPQLMRAVAMSTSCGARNAKSGPIDGLCPLQVKLCNAMPVMPPPTAIPKAANLHLALFRAKRMPTNGNAQMTKEPATSA
jgi:hypothetical protein